MENITKAFEGVTTALITPFTDEGKVDVSAFEALLDEQIQNGINGLLPLGTTGETPCLSDEEKEEIIKVTVKKADGNIPVLVGTGSNNTEHTVENSKKAKALGADAILVVTPYYNKPTSEGIYQHFKAVHDAVDIPIIVYNIAGRTGKNIDTQTMKRIAELKNVIGVKEASGSIDQMGEVIAEIASKQDFIVLSGDDGVTVPLLAIGGRGVVSVASNALPKEMVQMVNAGLNGDFEKARLWHYRLLPFFNVEFIETNPIPIKTVLAMKGMVKENFRLPMCKLQDENKKKLKEVCEAMKII